MNELVRLYRAWPYRPHCDSAAGVHAWTCRAAGVLHWTDDCKRTGAGCPDPSRSWVAEPRCPAKDA
jgi:hypothetical protein